MPAADGSFAWLFFESPMPGGSRVTLHLDGSTILAALDGAPLDVDGDGQPGGMLRASFTTVSLAGLPGTSLSGVVLDPGPDLRPMTFDDVRAGPDGILTTADDVYLRPLAGVKVFVVGREHHYALTDAKGRFRLDGVPAGNVKLAIDGRTVAAPPAGVFFPEMVMDLFVQAGVENRVMDSLGTFEERVAHLGRPEVYLPRLRTSILRPVSVDAPTVITAEPEATPNLTGAQRGHLAIEVQPGSLIDEQGRPMATGLVGISAVPPELVREMLPPGVLEHTFDITIQAPGVATFAVPAPLTFPNVFGAPPGTKLNFLSFDHTTGRLRIEGTATVSADGLSARTDPGMEITHPGWHGLTPEGGPGGPAGPPPLTPPLPPADRSPGDDEDDDPPVEHAPVALPMIAAEVGGLLTHPTLTWHAPNSGVLYVDIEVDGPLDAFMRRTGNLALTSQRFALEAGRPGSKTLSGTSRTYDELFGPGGFATIGGDALFGAQVRVTETLVRPDGSKAVEVRTFYLYRWVSAVYAPEARDRSGTTAAFQKTLNDGPLNWATTKSVEARLPSSLETAFLPPAGTTIFRVDDRAQGDQLLVWRFDPTAAATYTGVLSINVARHNLEVGRLTLRGTGINPVEINLNLDGYAQELKRVILDMVPAWQPGPDMMPGRFDVDDDGNGVIDDLSEYGWPGSDDLRGAYYKFSQAHPDVPPVLVLRDLRGPAIRLGREGTVTQYAYDPAHLFASHAGIAGTADDVRYRTFVPASLVFATEFAGFMPGDRLDPGSDGILGTYDDLFTVEQLAALDEFVAEQARALLRAVEADYAPIDERKGAFRFVDTAGDVAVTWSDVFGTASDGTASGPGGIGAPLYGFANFDADTRADRRGDGIVLAEFLSDDRVTMASRVWALAEELNVFPSGRANIGVAIHASFKSEATFAQFVANTVSHELAHTFGLLDAYLADHVVPPPGDPRYDSEGNAAPFDIMRKGNDFDGDLTFFSPHVQLLRAAMGIAPEGDVGDGVRLYRQSFNHPESPVGLRENTPPPVFESEAPDAVLVAVTESGFWYGGKGGPALGMGDVPVDGEGGERKVVSIGIHNAGGKPLDVSAIALVDGLAGFHLDAIQAIGDPIAPGDTVEIFVIFDPTVPGRVVDTIEIVSDSRGRGIVKVPLAARGVKHGPSASVALAGGGNLGGVPAGQGIASAGLVTLTNTGNQLLTLKDIRFGNTGPSRPLGVPVDLATSPRVLEPGESLNFGARFAPDRPGLAWEFVEVETDDPERPVLRFSLTGTGLPSGAPVAARWGGDFIAVDTPEIRNSPTLRTRSDGVGVTFVGRDQFGEGDQ